MKQVLDAHGFGKTELHLNEWHYYTGGDFNGPPEQFKLFVETMGGPDAAAYLYAVLTGWQDTPLTMGNYYTGTGVTWPGWGFYGLYGPKDVNKCYFAMKAFNLLNNMKTALMRGNPRTRKPFGFWRAARRMGRSRYSFPASRARRAK